MANKKKKPERKTIPSPIEIKEYDHDDMEFILNNPYECSACGRRYSERENNFLKSPSFLFGANDGYVPICMHCAETYVDHFAASRGVETAMRQLCERTDVYFDRVLLEDILDSEKITYNIIQEYFEKVTFEKTFDDTLEDDPTAFSKTNGAVIEDNVVDRWGEGYSDSDYRVMEKHYHMLKRQNPNCNSNQEIFIKDLCPLYLMKQEASVRKDADSYKKLSETYRATFKEAGLQTRIDTNDGLDETFGVNIGYMAKYAPEQFYKDKTLFRDYDGIDEYGKRNLFRPLKNLAFGTNEDDPENFVSPNDDGEDDE